MKKYSIDSEESLQTFTDYWQNDPDCSIVKWCRSVGEKSIKDAFPQFRVLIHRSPEHARWIFYHLGWLIDEGFRKELLLACAKSGVQAYHLFMEDETLTEEEDTILLKSILIDDPCPEYIATSDLCSRRKTEARQYNADSEIVIAAIKRGILNVSDSV